jgi:hypothetical protein
MANYTPPPFTAVMGLYIPVDVTAKGSTKKVYKKIDDFYCSYRTFGGTETVVNGVVVVENTAVIDTWYNPDIKSGCRVATPDGSFFEILGKPENINMRNQYMQFKIREIRGGA